MWFDDASYEERCLVEQCANQGQLHPDVEVARLSVEWARNELSKNSNIRTWVGTSIDVLIGVALGNAAGMSGVLEQRERRKLARKIVASAKSS